MMVSGYFEVIEDKKQRGNVRKHEYKYRKVFNSKKVHNRSRDTKKRE